MSKIASTGAAASDNGRRDAQEGTDVSTVKSDRADDLERYRRAAEDTLQQLDWCIGYLHAIGKGGEARMLAHNRQTIRTKLLDREAQPVPAGPTTTQVPRQT
jgi:hypothetical protein